MFAEMSSDGVTLKVKVKCWKCGNTLVSASMTKEINPVHGTEPPTRNSMKEVKRENGVMRISATNPI